MKLLILSRIFEVYSTQRLVEEAQGLGFEVALWTPADPLSECSFIPDVVIARFGSFEFQESLAALRQFETQGIPVINTAEAYDRSYNKWRLYQELQNLQLPSPKSFLLSAPDTFLILPPELSFPVVIKKLDSSQGRGVYLVQNKDNLEELRRNHANEDLLLQEWISEAQNTDIRAFIVGEKIVASMKRTAAPEEFRSNIHLGGTGEVCELTDSERQLALKVARHLNLEMAGIDFLRSARGSLILEANPCPGLEGIEACTGKNLARELALWAEQKVLKRRAL